MKKFVSWRAEDFFSALMVIAIFLTVDSCTHVNRVTKAIPDNAATVHLSPELTTLVRQVALHAPEMQGFTLGRWGTVFLIPADQVSAFLACHEGHHIEQFSAYDDDLDGLEAYAGAFVASTISAAIVKGQTELLILIPQILRGQVDPKTLALEVATDVLRAGYLNHPWELEANAKCEHLRQ